MSSFRKERDTSDCNVTAMPPYIRTVYEIIEHKTTLGEWSPSRKSNISASELALNSDKLSPKPLTTQDSTIATCFPNVWGKNTFYVNGDSSNTSGKSVITQGSYKRRKCFYRSVIQTNPHLYEQSKRCSSKISVCPRTSMRDRLRGVSQSRTRNSDLRSNRMKLSSPKPIMPTDTIQSKRNQSEYRGVSYPKRRWSLAGPNRSTYPNNTELPVRNSHKNEESRPTIQLSKEVRLRSKSQDSVRINKSALSKRLTLGAISKRNTRYSMESSRQFRSLQQNHSRPSTDRSYCIRDRHRPASFCLSATKSECSPVFTQRTRVNKYISNSSPTSLPTPRSSNHTTPTRICKSRSSSFNKQLQSHGTQTSVVKDSDDDDDRSKHSKSIAARMDVQGSTPTGINRRQECYQRKVPISRLVSSQVKNKQFPRYCSTTVSSGKKSSEKTISELEHDSPLSVLKLYKVAPPDLVTMSEEDRSAPNQIGSEDSPRQTEKQDSFFLPLISPVLLSTSSHSCSPKQVTPNASISHDTNETCEITHKSKLDSSNIGDGNPALLSNLDMKLLAAVTPIEKDQTPCSLNSNRQVCSILRVPKSTRSNENQSKMLSRTTSVPTRLVIRTCALQKIGAAQLE